MMHEEDYPDNDTTEASNITSLQSDAITADPNPTEPLSESIRTESNTSEERKIRDCKCREVHSSAKHELINTDGHGSKTKPDQVHSKHSLKNESPLNQFETSIPCICYTHQIPYTLPVQYNRDKARPQRVWCRFKWKWPRRENLQKKDKAYEVKLKGNKCPHYTKPFMCCEISEGIPKSGKLDKPRHSTTSVKSNNKEPQLMQKIGVYYFDHGNSAYYRTTDSPPILLTEKCAEKTDQAATRFWAEIFGTIHIGTAFITAFILQFLRFILYSIVRPLTVGILQLFADYFIKPLLSITFNALIQPVLILLYNIATSLKDLCEPLAEAIGFFLREIANLCAAIRLIEVKQVPTNMCT